MSENKIIQINLKSNQTAKDLALSEKDAIIQNMIDSNAELLNSILLQVLDGVMTEEEIAQKISTIDIQMGEPKVIIEEKPIENPVEEPIPDEIPIIDISMFLEWSYDKITWYSFKERPIDVMTTETKVYLRNVIPQEMLSSEGISSVSGVCSICNYSEPLVEGKDYCIYCDSYMQENGTSKDYTSAIRKKRPQMNSVHGKMYVASLAKADIEQALKKDVERACDKARLEMQLGDAETAIATLVSKTATEEEVKFIEDAAIEIAIKDGIDIAPTPVEGKIGEVVEP